MNFFAILRARASLVVVATLAAIGFGAVSLQRLPSGIYPDLDFPRIVVVAHLGDLPPDVVQTAATRLLEEAVATVPHMQRIRSRTLRGATELAVQFAPGTDMWRTLQLVEGHINEIRGELPSDIELRIERVTPTSLPIVTFSLAGNVDPRVLRETATRIIRPALTRVVGVGEIEVQGGDIREIQVILRPAALAAAHITPSEVVERVRNANQVTAVGRAQADHQVVTIVAASEPTTTTALAALPIGNSPSGIIALSSVADVIEGAEDRTTSVSGPDGDAVVITVARSPGASAPNVVAQAQEIITELRTAHALPPGVEIKTVYDQSLLIHEAINGVRDAIILGIVLSLIVLGLFLRNVRAGITAALAVPITLICTFGIMRLFGQTLNLMSLGGLAVAIGLVVDDAIVIVEAIVRRLEEGLPVQDAAQRGTQDLFAAVLGTTLTTVVVFAPMALLAGVVGSFFSALAVTLCAAVLLSLVVAVTFVPLVATKLLRPRRTDHAQASRVSSIYSTLLQRTMAAPLLSVAVVVLLAVLGWFAFGATTSGFLPAMDEGAMVVDFFAPQGTSLEETNHIARRLDRILQTTPGVATFTRRTGAEMGPAAATQQNRGDILVRLTARDQRASVYQVMDAVRTRVATEVPELRVEFVQVLQDVLDDLAGNPAPIEVKIFGPDPAQLQQLATEVGTQLATIDELEDIFNGVEGSVPILRADINPTRAMALGLAPATVLADLAISLRGGQAGSIRKGDHQLAIRVRMPDNIRFNPEAIAQLPMAYGGTAVPLTAIADLSRPISPAVLTRENLRQVVLATAALRHGADLGAVTETVRRKIASITVPAGYQLLVGGQQVSAKQTQRELLGVFGLGIGLVLVILLLQLRSLPLALLVLLTAPLAVVGAITTLYLFGIPLNASSMMGCVLLSGLVVKNGILLLEYAQQLHHENPAMEFMAALIDAGVRRLRPILMTTAATVVGLLPLALGLGPGAELQRPLAIATIGGLVLSTAVTLLIMPTLAARMIRPPRQAG